MSITWTDQTNRTIVSSLDDAWDVLDRLEAATTGDRLVRHFLDPGSKPIAPWPCSAALARISRSAGSWLGALSFHPRRLFRPGELAVLRLARRMLLNQRMAVESSRARVAMNDRK